MNAIFNRASVRVFKDAPVEKEKIEMLLKAAMQAPSAGNQQPWEFIVVEDKKTLEQLSETDAYAKFVAKVPAAIVVLGNTNEMRFPEHWEQDLGAACENILLEAVSQELGAVWLGVAPLKERMDHITKVFELPDNIRPYAIIPFGYAKRPYEVEERYDADRVHHEKYGQK
ncbi:nitroreductase family protein [Eubacterium maltosivorans]|uniref:Nitroreductase family protein n=1 Tax=Eubacterium maltosivorans TaxID=2041044 RepID=A0A4P9C4L3_EUBML|nr:nitroreductase family protein [Eubacterium maltosivorans]QCT70253.1 nitroreductase family protein [Eubacterium maltosivorans]